MRFLSLIVGVLISFASFAQTGFFPQVNTSGTNTYTVTFSGKTPAPATLQEGQRYSVKFINPNTGASTLTITGIGTRSIVNEDGTAVTAGQLKNIKFLTYDGTNFQITGGGDGKFKTQTITDDVSIIPDTENARDVNFGTDAKPLNNFNTLSKRVLIGALDGVDVNGSISIDGNGIQFSSDFDITKNGETIATLPEVNAKVVDAINDGVTSSASSQNALHDALQAKANLNNPALTGIPLAPTAAPDANNNQIANTEFVQLQSLYWVGVIATLHGASGDGVTDNYAILQYLINTYPGRPIIIGRSVGEVFILSRQLTGPSTTRIVVGGELKMKDANIRPILTTISNGTITVTVANASTYFSVGERVKFWDDNQPINGGGIWKTRLVAKSNTILSIVGDQITLSLAFANILGSGSITPAANGKIATAEGMFLFTDVTDIVVSGNGILNGNFANRANVAAAIATITGDEDLRSEIGIAFNNVTNSAVEGVAGKLRIKDFIMHGVATSLTTTAFSDNVNFKDLIFDGSVDKAIAGVNLINSTISDCQNINGRDEGEIILYNGCHHVTLNNIISKNNRRYGVASTGQNNSNIVFNNITSITGKNKPTTYNIYIQNQLFGFQGTNWNVSAEEMDATWSRSGTTVTVTTPIVHNLTNGQNVWIPLVVVNGGAFTVGAYATITTTSTTTFTFTGINAGFTNGSMTYLGMGADANVVINSCKSIKIEGLNIYNQKMSTVALAFSANTPYASTTTDQHLTNINIKDFYTGSVGNSAISFGNTIRANLRNVFVDGASRVFNDGSGNSDIKVENFRFQNYTALHNTNNGNIRLIKGNGSTTAGVAMYAETGSIATILSGSTSVIINHFLYKTPTINDIILTPGNMGNASSLEITTIDANVFIVSCKVDPGASNATFGWKINTYPGDVIAQPTYLVNSTSDFTAGTDSYSSLNVTLAGNIDAIGGVDNTLRGFATSTSGNHTISKAIAKTGNVDRLHFKFYMPVNTNVTGLRVQCTTSTGATDLYFLGTTGFAKGQWIDVHTAEFTPTATTVTFYLLNNFTTSFVGANSVTNDLIYLKDIIVEYR